jgi:hypothetical protein
MALPPLDLPPITAGYLMSVYGHPEHEPFEYEWSEHEMSQDEMFEDGMSDDRMSEHEMFMHKPLDHTKSSIRLLNVNPELSLDGLIQCTIIHATIDTSYNCLSYTWGDATPCHNILIDGRLMSIRKNLFDFLREVKRQKRYDKRLWVDAIWYVLR